MRKSEVTSRLPVRRGLGEVEAAAYLSLSSGFFRRCVDAGTMPKPRLLGGRRIWDIRDLDDAFDGLPYDGEHPSGDANEWDVLLQSA